MSRRAQAREIPTVYGTCHECKQQGRVAFDLYPYFLGFYRDKPVTRWAHRDCSDALYAKWRSFKADEHG